MKKQVATFVTLTVFLIAGVFMLERCKPKTADTTAITTSSNNNEYIGDQQCKSCHAPEYNNWLKSDHFKAMQKPTDSTVFGNFNHASYTADGVTSTFFKRDKKFFINTQGDDGKNHDYEVKYTFGFYPLQQYLVEFPGGRLQATRDSWDSRQKKWFHQYAGQKIDYHDWLHWTGNAQNWNTMCAECHSTNLQKNYAIDADTYHTTFSVINVSCEACHGPGKKHVDYINSAGYKNGKKIAHSFLQLNKGSRQLTQINACTPCHAVKENISANKINSDELLDDYIPAIPNTERFYADGQVNDEDYTYTSFLQSKMFHRNVKCSNCHNPHSGKVYLTGNQLCLQCHSKTYDAPSHHFHVENTTGAECKNCHMPGKYYMGNDYRYDHSFRVPRPDLSVKYATPNACNNCHKDKSARWAADAVVKWYGPKRKYHFADDLIPGSKLDANSEIHLTRLLGDTAVPAIIKATAANYLGNIPSQTSVNSLIKCLQEKDAQIRYEALRSLVNSSSSQWKNAAGPLLNDKVRAVRIAAADLFTTIAQDQIPPEYLAAYQQAKSELDDYLMYQADFAHSNITIADHFVRMKDVANAEKFYLRALHKDSLANLTRINLATLYNSQGRNREALNILKAAAKIDNKNDQIFYNMALLYNEMNDKPASLAYFEKAFLLNSKNPRLYYNYGLLLQQLGKSNKAIQVLEKGLMIDNGIADINYALAYVYLQNKQIEKARKYAAVLKRLAPESPDYQQLFTILGVN